MTWLLLRAVLVVVVACTGQSTQLSSQYWRDNSLRNISLLFHIELINYSDYSDSDNHHHHHQHQQHHQHQ